MNYEYKTSEFPVTIDDLLSEPDWDSFIHDRLGNDLFFADPDRAERIHKYAEDGADGSTHYEVIQDWREFAEYLRDEYYRAIDYDADPEGDEVLDALYGQLTDAIDEVEDRHDRAGTLHDIIG